MNNREFAEYAASQISTLESDEAQLSNLHTIETALHDSFHKLQQSVEEMFTFSGPTSSQPPSPPPGSSNHKRSRKAEKAAAVAPLSIALSSDSLGTIADKASDKWRADSITQLEAHIAAAQHTHSPEALQEFRHQWLLHLEDMIGQVKSETLFEYSNSGSAT